MTQSSHYALTIMNSHKKIINILLSSLAITTLSTTAEESLWLYTRGTDARPKASWELKLSNISRIGKDSGHYRFDDFRPEIEYGLTDRINIGAKVMLFNHRFSVTDTVADQSTPTGTTTARRKFDRFQPSGFELGSKINILSPYKDLFGLSAAAAYEHRSVSRLDGAEINQDTLYLSAMAQKNFFDDTLVMAMNAKAGFTRVRAGGNEQKEITLDLSAAISYRLAPKWTIGIEALRQSDSLSSSINANFNDGLQSPTSTLSNTSPDGKSQHAIYVGPTIHYAEQAWWFTLGALYQIDSGGDNVPTNRNWDKHEKWHLGATIGFEF